MGGGNQKEKKDGIRSLVNKRFPNRVTFSRENVYDLSVDERSVGESEGS